MKRVTFNNLLIMIDINVYPFDYRDIFFIVCALFYKTINAICMHSVFVNNILM